MFLVLPYMTSLLLIRRHCRAKFESEISETLKTCDFSLKMSFMAAMEMSEYGSLVLFKEIKYYFVLSTLRRKP